MQEKECDIKGCNSQATNIITSQNSTTYYTVAMHSFPYQDFKSEESLDKTFNLKGDVYVHCKDNLSKS